MAEPDPASKASNRTVIIIGLALAVVAAVILALVLGGRGGQPSQAVDEDAPGGLTVDVADAPALEPTRELRCFVDGQFVGMATLQDCARRNGLATDALDVGLDATGALAAAPTAAFDPPPEAPAVALVEAPRPQPQPQPADQPQPTAPAAGPACLRYAGSEWRNIGDGLSQTACVRALFAGTCVRPGEALYGRYGDTTLRLVPRRVEQSPDNTRFRTLVEQDRNCQFPSLG